MKDPVVPGEPTAGKVLENALDTLHYATIGTADTSGTDSPSAIGESTLERLQSIGRYRVVGELGSGAFGRVFHAHDDELKREVAIKIPRAERFHEAADAESYMAEARALASLDHPGIVPVYDVGLTTDGLPFVVSKFVAGGELAQWLKSNPPFHQSATVVAKIAAALHYAHGQGIVHRDIKPSNILLASADRPLVADFGLALKEEDFGKGAGFAGTPAYMSPEQAGGQGNRVDGRSDIFSLGIILYELLTGRRPFRADKIPELLEQIRNVEVRPPRQVNDAIPAELERICLKALQKAPGARYTTAKDFGEDLLRFVQAAEMPAVVRSPAAATPAAREAKVESGMQVGNLGCSLRVVVTLIVLLVVSASLYLTGTHSQILSHLIISGPSDPASPEEAAAILQRLIDAGDRDGALEYLERLREKSPSVYFSSEVQKFAWGTDVPSVVSMKISINAEQVREIEEALLRDDWEELESEFRRLLKTAVPTEEDDSRQYAQLKGKLTAATQHHQDEHDFQFRRQLNELEQLASKLHDPNNLEQVAELTARAEKLLAFRRPSKSVKEEVLGRLQELTDQLEKKNIPALREALSLDAIQQSVGTTAEYVASLEKYIAAFPDQPRSKAFRQVLTKDARAWEGLDRWNELINYLDRTNLTDLSASVARALLPKLDRELSLHPEIPPEQLLREFIPVLMTIAKYDASDARLAIDNLTRYFQNLAMDDPLLVITSKGDRYSFRELPKATTPSPHVLIFKTLSADSADVKEVLIADADIVNPKFDDGTFDWNPPQQRIARKSHQLLRNLPVLPAEGRYWPDQTFEELWKILDSEKFVEPLVQLQMARQIFGAGRRATLGFGIANEPCFQHLESLFANPRQPGRPRLSTQKERELAVDRLKELQQLSWFNLEVTSKQLAEADRPSPIGWLRRRSTGWVASIPSYRPSAFAQTALPANPADAKPALRQESSQFYVLSSSSAGVVHAHPIGTFVAGVATVDTRNPELLQEGQRLYLFSSQISPSDD